MSADVALVAALVIGFALISKRIAPTPLSAPMVFVAAGLLAAPELLQLVEFELEHETIDVIGEATLAILLFSDASRIDVPRLRHEYMLPARLLGIGLPLTVAATTGIIAIFVDGVDVWHAALIASILTPTDAALGQEVVTDPSVPVRIRQGLNVESGLNDGLVVPAVAVFVALATDDGDTGSVGWWAGFVGRQLGLGVLVGLVVGIGGAWLLNRARTHGWVDGVWAQLATLSLAVVALTGAITLGGNGFIAAFVAGLVFGKNADRSHHLGEFTEDAAQLAAAVSFFLFGNVLLAPAIDEFSGTTLLCGLLVLTAARMIPVAIAMIGTGAAAPTRVFLGWFGPRGLASILFGLILIEENLDDAEALFAIVAWTVALSVLLHGASAAPGARRYGQWWASMSEDERAEMPESRTVDESRVRSM